MCNKELAEMRRRMIQETEDFLSRGLKHQPAVNVRKTGQWGRFPTAWPTSWGMPQGRPACAVA